MDSDSTPSGPSGAGAEAGGISTTAHVGRLDALERALGTLESEIRTSRLVICDDTGCERIVGEVVDGEAMVRIELPDSREGRRSGVVLYADPAAYAGPALGIQLWADGSAVAVFEAWNENDSWRAELKILGDDASTASIPDGLAEESPDASAADGAASGADGPVSPAGDGAAEGLQ